MQLTQQTVSDLLAAFRSSAPTPGGGSASALAGAVGASLLAMVAGIPKPRAATDQDAGALARAGSRCGELSTGLERLIDRDSEAYETVVAAYRLPKTSADEKAVRSARIQDALRAAIDAPLAVMRACAEALDEAAVIAAYGNRNASSDVQVGLELLAAGLRGAKVNVDINLDSVKDQEYAGRTRQDVERLTAHAESTVARARARLSEAV